MADFPSEQTAAGGTHFLPACPQVHPDQQQQQQQQQEQLDNVIRLLLSVDPRSALARQLLPLFYAVCSDGRAAALGTVVRLRLDKAMGRGLPYRLQLSLMLGAKRATALTLHTSQITGLLIAAIKHRLGYQQQQDHQHYHHQQQQQQQEEEEGEGHEELLEQDQMEGLQELADALRGRADHHMKLAGTTTTASAATSSSRGASATIIATTITLVARIPHVPNNSSSSSSSSGGGGANVGSSSARASGSSRSGRSVAAHASQATAAQAPGAQEQGPRFTQLSVLGPLSPPVLQRLMQLLDVLPGTQQLRCIALAAEDRSDLTSHYHFGWDWDAQDMVTAAGEAPPRWRSRPICDGKPTFSAPSSSSNSSQQACAGAGSNSSCWRSSCHTLLLYDTGSLGGTDLGLLLGALPQLQGMYMPQRWASNQPPFDEVLRRVRALHVKYWASSIDLLQLLPSWTNLQHLSFIGVHFPKHPSVPLDACSSLVGLRNLVIQDTTMTNEGLAVLCSATGLRHLDVTHNTNVTALPKAISRLTSLHTLIMVHTKIYSLPWGTTALRSLRKLVWEARMPRGSPTNAAEPQLHQVVWQLRSLQHLTISLGTTVTLSPAIGDLTGLRQLCVDGAIKEVPESIGRLVGLEQLTLRSYLLRELPSSITALSQLTCIRLDCHQLQLQELSPAVQAFVRPRLQLLGPSGWV